MAQAKSSFLDRVLTRIGRLDTEGLQTVVTRLARERSFLETLFNAIDDGVVVVDENGRIIYFNEAATRLLNWTADEVEGRPIADFLPQLKWEALSAPGPRGRRGAVHQELEVTFPRSRFLRVYATPLDGDAKGSSGMALILHDATEARQQTYEAIENERIHSLTLLAGSVAHEIGNPLNALHIHLQLLTRQVKKLRSVAAAQSPPNSETDEIARKLDHYLDVARGEITRLDYIVTQYLQAIRPSAPQLAAGSLNDVARETLELLRPEMENRGLTIKEKLARRLPLSQMDSNQMKQVLVNLIKNAMQAMTRGGTLTVQSGAGDDSVWVSVGDTGGGIPQDQVNHIFEPFYTTKKKGTGLGLMIVQRIVSRHNGRIELESHVGQGTTFRIYLPSNERPQRLLGATKE
jgi:two-component system, sporulation sensor kinase E